MNNFKLNNWINNQRRKAFMKVERVNLKNINNIPLLLQIDWANLNINHENLEKQNGEPLIISNGNKHLFSAGLGTQFNNGLKLEFGIFNIFTNYLSNDFRLTYLEGGHSERNFYADTPLYFKIGYDRLPF